MFLLKIPQQAGEAAVPSRDMFAAHILIGELRMRKFQLCPVGGKFVEIQLHEAVLDKV
jgi:hypothetical protein